MTASATLHRFRIDLSDVDRGVYEQLDFRVSKHSSESDLYFVTRILAYVLNFQSGIEFSAGGLSTPEDPAIFTHDASGSIDLWIEIGSPSAKKLHRASKAATRVKVYTHKDPQITLREVQTAKIHRVELIDLIPFPPEVLERLARDLSREVRWQVLHHDDLVTVSVGDQNEQIKIVKVAFPKNAY